MSLPQNGSNLLCLKIILKIDRMEYRLEELIDIAQFQTILDKLNEIYSFPSAIIDNKGNVLTATAWQDICTKFHRVNTKSELECIKSDKYISEHLAEANPAISYHCPHGMVDNAIPIVINGKHIANFFTGQLFLDKPDLEFFKTQAKIYSFDEKSYLEAVAKVPIWTKEKLDNYLLFIKSFTEMIAGVGYKHLIEIENLKLLEKKDKELEESEAKFRAIFENSQDAIGVSRQGINVFLNPAYITLFGYSTHEELSGTSILEQIAPSARTTIIEYINKRAKGEYLPNRYETIGIRKNGEEFDFEIGVDTYLMNNDKYTIAIIRDISGKKNSIQKLKEQNEEYEALNEELRQTNDELQKAKEKAEESEARFKNLFERHNAIMLLIEPDSGLIIDANKAAVEFYGYDKSKLCSMFINEINTLNTAQIKEERIKAVNQNRNFFIFPHKLANGEERIVEVHSSPIDYHGKKILFSIIHDITVRKQAEEALIKSEERFRTLFENVGEGIGFVNSNEEFVFANPAAERIFGVATGELAGKNLYEFLSEEQLKTVLNQTKIRMQGRNSNYEFELTRPDGKKRNLLLTAVHQFDTNNNYIGAHGIFRDITERKIAEIELFKALEKASESDRLKTSFLQNMSHEIRTPMNAIIGFSKMLEKPELSAEKRKIYTTIINNSSTQLLSIVSDILTISSLETKQEKTNIHKVCINSIIIDLLATLKNQAINQNISLYAKQQLNDLESEIYTDKIKFTQILNILLTNALKFTHKGFIEFGYTLVETQNFESRLQQTQNFASLPQQTQNFASLPQQTQNFASLQQMKFYVKDTGIGIKPEEKNKIFERFRHADNSISQKYGGTGLGLSISKGFMELLGGEIWVESEPDKGSTFYFTIPYNPVNKIEKTDLPNKPGSGVKTILVAEDGEYNYLFIEELLLEMNYKIIHAKDGKETVEICKANAEIDLILMDIKMPIMDGHSAAKEIKEFRPNLPIIAQTAYALENERKLFSGPEFDDYVTKPIDKNELKNKVMKYLK